MMAGFRVFLSKELAEIRRTWRIWVVPGMMIFFAVTGPLIALLTPRMLESIARSQPGVTIQVPNATAVDAYAQFLKNLSELVVIALIIGGAGSISGERSAGTAAMVLTKPLSRGAFVMAKLVAQLVLLIVATVVATGLTFLTTRALFPPISAAPLVTAVALWMVEGALIVCAVTFFSALFRSRGASSGAGLVFFFLVLILAIWPAAGRHTFVGLPRAISAALRGVGAPVAAPVITALAGCVVFAVASVRVFRGKEI